MMPMSLRAGPWAISAHSSMILLRIGEDDGTLVKIVPMNAYGPQIGWWMHLQQPRSSISKPR